MVWVPPALLQPIVSDDAAAGLAVSGPLNGAVELVGAEPTRMDDLVRRFLATNRDVRECAAEAAAVLRYGRERRSLTAGDSPCLGSARVGN